MPRLREPGLRPAPAPEVFDTSRASSPRGRRHRRDDQRRRHVRLTARAWPARAEGQLRRLQQTAAGRVGAQQRHARDLGHLQRHVCRPHHGIAPELATPSAIWVEQGLHAERLAGLSTPPRSLAENGDWGRRAEQPGQPDHQPSEGSCTDVGGPALRHHGFVA